MGIEPEFSRCFHLEALLNQTPKSVEPCDLLDKLLIWFGLVSLFNGISTFVGYLMPKPSF